MKFIVDSQLSRSLSEYLNQIGHNSLHTLNLPDKNKTKDSQVADIANKEGRILITKDIDFLESFILKSEPRKLILVKKFKVQSSKFRTEIF